MEFEEVHHVFDPFGYGNLMGVKYSPRQWGERFAAVKATVSPGSVSVVTRFLEMGPSAVRAAFDRKAVQEVELSRRRLSVLCDVPFIFRIIVKRLEIRKAVIVLGFHMWWFGIR